MEPEDKFEFAPLITPQQENNDNSYFRFWETTFAKLEESCGQDVVLVTEIVFGNEVDDGACLLREFLNQSSKRLGESTDSKFNSSILLQPGNLIASMPPRSIMNDGKDAKVVLLTAIFTGNSVLSDIESVLLGFCLFMSHHILISETAMLSISAHINEFKTAMRMGEDTVTLETPTNRKCPAHVTICNSQKNVSREGDVGISTENGDHTEEIQKLLDFFETIQYEKFETLSRFFVNDEPETQPTSTDLELESLRFKFAHHVSSSIQIPLPRFQGVKKYFNSNFSTGISADNLLNFASPAKYVLNKLVEEHQSKLGTLLVEKILCNDLEIEQCHTNLLEEILTSYENNVIIGTPSFIMSFRDELLFQIKPKFSDDREHQRNKRSMALAEIQLSCSEFEGYMNDEIEVDFTIPNKLTTASSMYKPNIKSKFKRANSDKFTETELCIVFDELTSQLQATEASIIRKNKELYNAAELEAAETMQLSKEAYSARLNGLWHDSNDTMIEDVDSKVNEINNEIISRFQKLNAHGPEIFRKKLTTTFEKEMHQAFEEWYGNYTKFLDQFEREKDEEKVSLLEACKTKIISIIATLKNIEDIYSQKDVLMAETEKQYQSTVLTHVSQEERIRLSSSFIFELKQIFNSSVTDAMDKRKVHDQLCQKRIDDAIQFYTTKIGSIAAEEYLLDQNVLPQQHNVFKQEAICEFSTEKDGIQHQKTDEYLQELEMKIEAEYAKQKIIAQNVVDEFDNKTITEISEIMEPIQSSLFNQLDSCADMKSLNQLFQKHETKAVKALQNRNNVTPNGIMALKLTKLKVQLKAMHADTCEGFAIILEARSKNTEAAIIEARKIYEVEMAKHTKNCKFKKPGDLIAFNSKIQKLILDRFQSNKTLLPIQVKDIKKGLDLTFETHKKEFYKHFGTDLALGIDLGTTYTCVAVYHQNEVKIIPNPVGQSIIPSYVRLNDKGETEKVGIEAKETAYQFSENTIFDAKRIIGRKFDDPQLQAALPSWPFSLVNQNGVPKFAVGTSFIPPEQVSAAILHEMKTMSQIHLGVDVKKAVITVPAYFSDTQRQATIDAGRCAGLEVMAVLQEPVAASVAFRLDQCEIPLRHILIYDLGGGTFDVAVLKITYGEIEALAIGGNSHLGGRNFDENMMNYCVQEFKEMTGIDFMDDSDSVSILDRVAVKRRLERLRSACEKNKLYLSAITCDMVVIDLPCFYTANNKTFDLKIEISRQKFEQLNQELFDSTIAIIDECLKSENISKEMIDDIVLVGGSTKIPKIREILSEYFGGAALSHNVNPEEAVAHGAAIYAAILNGQITHGEKRFTTVQDITPLSIGVDVICKRFSKIIPRDIKVPTKLTNQYCTSHDNQTCVIGSAFQGDDEDNTMNAPLGTFKLDGILPALSGKEKIDVTMETNKNGVLNVAAVCKSTGDVEMIEVTAKKWLHTDDQITEVQTKVCKQALSLQMEQSSATSLAALGNVASLGDLYDARKENFCGRSIFMKPCPDSALTHKDDHFCDIQLLHNDSFSEKFSKLDVSAELQVSILSGLFKLEGSGRCLKDQKSSSRSVKSSLVYKIHTKEDKVNIFNENLKDIFDLNAIQSSTATHVIVGISWGANCVLSCEYLDTENRDIQEIEGNLSAQLNKLALSISGSTKVVFNAKENNKGAHFSIKVYGDVLPRNQDLPTSFEGGFQLMQQLPSLVETCNEGRGMPLKYKLIPLSLLQDYHKFEMRADLKVKTLQEDSLVRIVQLFEKLSESQQKLNDFQQDATKNKIAIPELDFTKIISMVETFSIEEAKFRSDLGNMLAWVRSGHAEGDDLEKLLGRFQSSPCSPTAVNNMLAGMSHLERKIAFARTLTDACVVYIGYGNSLDDEIIKHMDRDTYVLLFNEQCKSDDASRWQKTRHLFFEQIKSCPDFKYIAVDCDIHLQMWPSIGVSIHVLKNGKVVTQDLVESNQRLSNIPVAKCTFEMKQMLDKPNQRVNLTIPCTGLNCSPTTVHEWQCWQCNQVIEYGFDTFFYCGCGCGPISFYEFKCPDPLHGVAFERHVAEYLEQLLGRLRSIKELNILILGETGVGKSTWINGFMNFLTFESLQEAEKHDLCSLIPSQFTVFDKDLNEIKVSTGEDKNEVKAVGQSATQECTVYTFPIGGVMIRLIDTPGIGDTRGDDQDKKNCQNILSTLSYLQELHGICILLKPNNSRLSVTFRFCIKELLTYLHRDASRNIMFCFTNSRGTFYRPGDTLPALKVLLNENKNVIIPISNHTIYCYDSEAYRFLSAIKNKKQPVQFADDERDNFAKSWEKSFSETKRMLKHISGLKPHPIQNTINLNHSRELVVQLTRPLAEISKTIQANKEVIKDHIEDIRRTKDDLKDLQAKRFCDKVELEITNINHPKTVCTNSKCTSIYGNGEFLQTKYRTVCHSRCGLTGVVHDTVGDPRLLECHAITNGFCSQSNCGHNYKEHMHVYYDSKEVIKQVEIETVKQQINQNISAAELKQKMIQEQEKNIQEQDEELQQIELASVKFACFLKHNAITPYNDAMLEYMDHLIGEEKKKIKVGGTRRTLEKMKLSRDSYEIQTKILDKEMARGDRVNILNPADVEKLVNHLYKLPHNGQTIKTSLDAVRSSHGKIAQYREVPSTYKPAKQKKIFKPFFDWIES